MANLDISSKLGHEKQEITIAEGKTYEVNCGAIAFLKVQEQFEKGEVLKAIELLLGKKAVEDIEKMKLTIKEMQIIIIAAAAQANETSYEEMEKRFQNNK